MKLFSDEKILLAIAGVFAAVSIGMYFSLNYAGIGLTKIGTSSAETVSNLNGAAQGQKSPEKSDITENSGENPVGENETGAEEAGAPININTADVAGLVKIQGVGETIAQRIVEYRIQNGPFKSVEELMNIKGIGPVNFEKMRPSITVK